MSQATMLSTSRQPVAPALDNDDYTAAYAQHVQDDESRDALAWMQKMTDPDSGAEAAGRETMMPSVPAEDARELPDASLAWGAPSEGRGMFSNVLRNISDIPLSVGHGAVNAANEAVELVYELADHLRQATPEWMDYGVHFDFRDGEGGYNLLPEVSIYRGKPEVPQIPQPFDDPDTPTGEVTSKIAQFLTGFVSGGRVLKGAKAATTSGRIAKAAAQGGIADFAFFDGQEERLSNLVQEIPALRNPISEYLAASGDDGRIEGRFKNALEGLGVGVATDGLFTAVKALKAARNAKKTMPGAEERAGREIVQKAPASAFEVLGNPGGPLVGSGKAESAWSPARRSATEWGGEAAQEKVYINFARIDSPEDVRVAMQKAADLYKPEIDAARRGRRTFEEIKLSAEQEDAWKILAGRRNAEPLNAEQSLAARNLWASSGEKLSETARLASAAPTEENLFAFRKMLEVHRAIQSEVVAARTETARALASWRIPSGPQELMRRQIDDVLEGTGGMEASRELAERVAKLSDAGMVEELEAFVTKTPARIARESIQEAWVMALLSGPKTHLVNMMSNTTVALQQVFERGVAGTIGRITGDTTGVQVGEALSMLNGMIGGAKDGLRLAGKALRMNEAGGWAGKVDLPHDPAISAENWRLAKDSAMGKAVDVLGAAVRVPGRALMAEDEFFKSVGYRMELHAQAYRQASREATAGKIGKDEIRSRMVDILDNPPDNIRIAAIDHATYSTFTNAPGEFAKGYMKFCQKFPALRFVTPFIKTPANIFNYAIAERSPFAPLFRSFREDLAAGGARQQLALARVSTGTTLMLAAADLAFNGQITGGGPPNMARKETLKRTGWQPYSIKVGDRYFSFSRMDPLGMTFGIAADLAEISMHTDQEDREVNADEAAVYFAAAIAGNTMSKSYMRGLSDAVEALANPKQRAEGWSQRFAGSFVPAGVAEVTRFNDPYMLEVNSMLDAMKARIPGLSAELPARRDLWGRAISYRSGLNAFYDAVSPIASRRENPEPIDREMLRLETYVPAPKRRESFDGVPVDLTNFGDAYSRFAQLAGNGIKHPAWGKGCMDFLNDVVNGRNPMAESYKLRSDGPEGGKAQFIRATVYQYRDMARKQLLEEYPDLQRYVEQKKLTQPGKWNF